MWPLINRRIYIGNCYLSGTLQSLSHTLIVVQDSSPVCVGALTLHHALPRRADGRRGAAVETLNVATGERCDHLPVESLYFGARGG